MATSKEDALRVQPSWAQASASLRLETFGTYRQEVEHEESNIADDDVDGTDSGHFNLTRKDGSSGWLERYMRLVAPSSRESREIGRKKMSIIEEEALSSREKRMRLSIEYFCLNRGINDLYFLCFSEEGR